MKKFATIALLTLGLATAVSAAYTTGVDFGYLTDNKDAYWSGRVGWEFKNTASLSQRVELELGYTRHSENFFGSLREETKLTPLTINYRAETTPADKLGFYFGAGVGQSWVHVNGAGSGAPSF